MQNSIYIIVGLGIVGSATAYELARRGHKVLAFDAHHRGHSLGSSHGRTRITRQAYFEAPDYVPLIQRSQHLWETMQQATNRKLFSKIGAIFLGEPGCELVEGSLRSARDHGLAHELLDATQIERRFTAFRVPPDAIALLEPNAGILHADECLTVLQSSAVDLGAELHFEEPVLEWRSNSDSSSRIIVRTTIGEYEADGLVIAAGPWTPQVLQELQLPLKPRRVLCAHFDAENDSRFAPDKLPVWCLQFDNAFLYGFPSLPEQGLKVGRHDDGEPCTADGARREITSQELEQLRSMVERFLPGAALSVRLPLTCLYTDTPDGQFIVERHPAIPNVAYMAGCCGHAFKFAPVLGEILADLVTAGVTQHPIGFLSSTRPSLTTFA